MASSNNPSTNFFVVGCIIISNRHVPYSLNLMSILSILFRASWPRPLGHCKMYRDPGPNRVTPIHSRTLIWTIKLTLNRKLQTLSLTLKPITYPIWCDPVSLYVLQWPRPLVLGFIGNTHHRCMNAYFVGITSISATIHIGHNHIGHTEDDIGHRQSRYRTQVDIGHTISATNV